jgi:uncharacterized protein CbrC (UPF0167 family)
MNRRGREFFRVGRPLPRSAYQRPPKEDPVLEQKQTVLCVVMTQVRQKCCRCNKVAESQRRSDKTPWCLDCAARRNRTEDQFDTIIVDGEKYDGRCTRTKVIREEGDAKSA